MSIERISPHFCWGEAECHDGTEVPLELQPNAIRLAVNVLELVRERFGGPLHIVSWYRSPYYNERIHGAVKSRHLVADGADVRPTDLDDLPRLRAVIETMLHQGELPALGGFGVYRGWLHLDCRPKPAGGHVARWFGKGVGSEQA